MIRSAALRKLIQTPEFSDFLANTAKIYGKYYQYNPTFNLDEMRGYGAIPLQEKIDLTNMHIDIFDIVIQTFYLKNECSLQYTNNPWVQNFVYAGTTAPSISVEDIKKVFDRDFIQKRVYDTLLSLSKTTQSNTAHHIVENLNAIQSYRTSRNITLAGNPLYTLILEVKIICNRFVRGGILKGKTAAGLPTEYAFI